MDTDSIAFLEKDVCDGSAWSLKWGTLVLYPAGLVFYYNRPRKDSPGRMQDAIKMSDILGVSEESIDWLVSKVFWVGRRPLTVRTNEGEKTYYMRGTGALCAGIKLLRPSVGVTSRKR